MLLAGFGKVETSNIKLFCPPLKDGSNVSDPSFLRV